MAPSPSSRRRNNMSQEDALEEDRLEILELLDRPAPTPALTKKNRNSLQSSPASGTLDVSPGPLPARPRSIAGVGVGVTSPPERRPAAFDLAEPASSPLRMSSSATALSASQTGSEGFPYIPSEGPDRASSDGSDANICLNCQSELPSTSSNQGRSKQQTQERPPSKAIQGRNANAAVMGNFDLKVIPSSRGRDLSRRSAPRGLSLDSRTISYARSLSPSSAQWMNTNPFHLAAKSEKIITEKGNVIDKSNAHKYLSDEALSQSSGSLASLSRSGSRHGSDSDGARSPGDERLEKDIFAGENNQVETSEEECNSSSSDDDGSPSTRRRPSKRDRKSLGRSSSLEDDDPARWKPKPRKSMLEVAEEAQARQDAETGAARPGSPVPSPNSKKSNVHPRTNFDHNESALNTPFGSEDEAELSDIKKAQKLSILMSSIDSSIPNRAVRTLTRGDYGSFLGEVDGVRRRQRKYLVATDLSEKSVYALEWTIGTILRDGDTLFAVCALPDETGPSPPVQPGEGGKAASDVGSIDLPQTEEPTRHLQHDGPAIFPRSLRHFLGQGTDHKSGSPDNHGMSKAETDRVHTVETISQTCVKLLRKTLLQVRIAVEVIHCKSPRHMITEAIDGLDPTLVVVGAKGTSGLKGVLLGSFSNYLVSKSSVPVMVARTKLKKQTKQTKRKTNVRFSNNLTTPKRLAMAKVD